MQKYESKMQYLMHLKNISAIKNGHSKRRKPETFSRPIFQNSSSAIDFKLFSKTLKETKWKHFNKKNIYREFSQNKENTRLVTRIEQIPSFINVRKYQKDYQEHKKLISFHQRNPTSTSQFNFYIYDISFRQIKPDPSQIFQVYQLLGNKRKLLAEGTIFWLRKKQMQGLRTQTQFLLIEGRISAMCRLRPVQLNVLTQNGEVVGNIVLAIQ